MYIWFEIGDSEDDEEDDEKEGELPQQNVDNSEHTIVVGTLGHPNVGKSSLINGIMGRKVVSTSRTPGHTKHFQTIYITKGKRNLFENK